MFPAYAFGKNPDLRFIATSYTSDLASSMNRDVQRIIDLPRYQEVFPNTRLASHNARSVAGKALRNSEAFEIVDNQGSYLCAGVNGGITGKGGDILCVDDPVRSEADAQSPTFRQKTWEWFTNTLLSRQQTGAAVIVTMTRWHFDDLTGRIIMRSAESPKADQWRHLCFPAIREDDADKYDPRQIGDALWPDAYGLEFLESMRAAMGESGFAGLYQQRPSVAGGSVFKEHNWRFWYQSPVEPAPVLARGPDGSLVACCQERLPAKFDRQFQSWDCTFKDSARSDWVVGQVWGRAVANAYLLDQIRARIDFPATLIALRQLTNKWPRARAKIVEDKANGPAVVSNMRREIAGLIAINPDGGKVVRANAVAPYQESGNLFLPHPSECSWVREFIAECNNFPKGKFDDQVDAMTQGVNWSYGKKRVSKVLVAYS